MLCELDERQFAIDLSLLSVAVAAIVDSPLTKILEVTDVQTLALIHAAHSIAACLPELAEQLCHYGQAELRERGYKRLNQLRHDLREAAINLEFEQFCDVAKDTVLNAYQFYKNGDQKHENI